MLSLALNGQGIGLTDKTYKHKQRTEELPLQLGNRLRHEEQRHAQGTGVIRTPALLRRLYRVAIFVRAPRRAQ